MTADRPVPVPAKSLVPFNNPLMSGVYIRQPYLLESFGILSGFWPSESLRYFLGVCEDDLLNSVNMTVS